MVFHPPLVHYPIAFYFLELALLLLWWKKNDPAYRRFALFSFRMGYFFTIAAFIAGYIDSGAKFPVPQPVRPHALTALGLFTFYTIRAGYWHWARGDGKFYRRVLIAGAMLGNILLLLTAFLGGKLVYD